VAKFQLLRAAVTGQNWSAFTKKLRTDYTQEILLFLKQEIKGFNFMVL
jgi:hypothetical protein